MRRAFLLKVIAIAQLGMVGCGKPEATGQEDAVVAPLAVGESRAITLRHTPLEVQRFERRLTREELARVPRAVLASTWLMDLELLSGADGRPRMLDYALLATLASDATDPTLSVAEANLIRLLRMSPSTADVGGTSLAPVMELAPHLGFTAAEVLSDVLGVEPSEPFLSPSEIGRALVKQVIATHPNAQARPGPVTAENPEGRYDVTAGSLPVFLDDVLFDLETLAARYGPYDREGQYHPGFIWAPVSAQIFGLDMALVVRANVNGVPDKGVDLETATLAGVNSIDNRPETLFDFGDPDWLRLEGTAQDPPTIDTLGFFVAEAPRYITPGDSREPAPYGNAEVWTAPADVLERVVAEAAFARWCDHEILRTWERGGSEPLMRAEAHAGWLQLHTAGDVGPPPPAAYVWDLLLEVAQARLHDHGLAEGEVSVVLRHEDVPLGFSMRELLARIKAGVEQEPYGFARLASILFDNTWGEADLFYQRLYEEQADYLFFVEPEDLPLGPDGTPKRGYAYPSPGFYADPELQEPLGSRALANGDAHHMKLAVEPGDELYCSDEHGQTYRVEVQEKPSRAQIALTVTRIR